MIKVRYLTHAALEYTTALGTKIVCDPWILDEPVFNFTTWKFPAPIVSPNEIVSDVDWMVITHSHEDHFHVPSLDRFPRSTRILLPEYASHPHLRAHTVERTLRAMGFKHIQKIQPWSSLNLDADTSITIIPSADTRQHDWENCGFVIGDADTRILNMNDNVSDVKLCEEIKARWPHLDLGFIQSLGVTMWPGRFKLTDEEIKKAVADKRLSFDEQQRMVDIVAPDAVVPFAGDFCWLAERYHHQNWCNRGTPELFNTFMEEHAKNKACQVLLMLPGDEWSKERGWVKNHPGVDWNNYLAAIDIEIKKKHKKVEAIDSWLQSSDTKNLVARTETRLEAIKSHVAREYLEAKACVEYSVLGSEPFSFYVWLDESGFGYSFSDYPEKPFQTLYLEAYEMAAILECKLTFNIVQWVALAEQHYLPEEVGKFWYWLEYHIDLNTKNTQVYLDDKIVPAGIDSVMLSRGVFDS